jgi:hypothetical protein
LVLGLEAARTIASWQPAAFALEAKPDQIVIAAMVCQTFW